ncbi:sigma E protease regulator RseP [Arsukibacterium sp.]|uniref:sigma E protease regulator RseP n=1 Tax=Arsukibacterium sp. TaxID=1977258 RepID=UPI00299EA9BC|nr:sigma E protease regulator RseP [Arsukibacterium sp.]MDX1677518.1 sigma E protease regulator RseP [Arsukibacterium sp.]
MTVFLWNAFTFVIALGLLVTVHEFGHFWVARKNGVLVKRFSIGFGKALFSWRDRQGTEFVIAAIPLGGYVRMLDERVDPVLPQFADLAFNHKTVWQRMAIIAAGPAANFIFAIFILWLMYMIGVQEAKPVIADVQPQSIVAEAGVRGNEQIISINGHSARDLRSTNLLLVEQLGRGQMTLGLQDIDSGQQRQVQLDLADWQFNPEQQSVFASLGIKLLQPEATTELAQIVPGSAAALAGMQPGDIIVRIDDEPIADWSVLERLIQQNAEQTLRFEINRAGQLIELSATPELLTRDDGFTQGMLGVQPVVTPWPEGIIYTQRYGVIGAVKEGISQTWQLTRLSFAMVAKLLTGDVSVRHLSGPISIAQGAGDTASMGLIAFLAFLALISVNLAVINLLPLPILDGGHLMYLVVELIRGKPVSEKAQEIGFRCGALVLLMLMGIALLNDISRL